MMFLIACWNNLSYGKRNLLFMLIIVRLRDTVTLPPKYHDSHFVAHCPFAMAFSSETERRTDFTDVNRTKCTRLRILLKKN